MWAGQWYKYKHPRQFITSGGLGSMGFGYPAALGMKVALPDKQVIDIDGDGSFLMNIQELATAHVEKIAAKAIILNNQHLGMVVQWEDNFYAGNRGHTYLGDPEHRPEIYPDYVRVCNSFGVKCERVMFKNDLRAAIQRMLDADEPYVLDVVTPIQHARHPVHSRRQDRGGHDLEAVIEWRHVLGHPRLASGQDLVFFRRVEFTGLVHKQRNPSCRRCFNGPNVAGRSLNQIGARFA